MRHTLHKTLFLFFLLCSACTFIRAQEATVISISPDASNDCKLIREAVEQAKELNGAPVVLKFSTGTYHLRRTQATAVKYYISNTVSWGGNPDNIKYIGMYLKDLKNVTIDGTDARFITHGELTSIIVDNCENITFKNFALDAADPSLTEMAVESIENNRTFIFKAHDTSNFEISGTTLGWKGEGWSFTGGPSQIYDPTQDITWRSWSPQSDIQSISAIDQKRLRVVYNSEKDAKVGYTFQMRDGVRDQVAGFILKSKNVTYEGVKLHFLGNFGIVCQYSDGINFLNCTFAPDSLTGRTGAGFADFLQVSGCKGLLKVENCKFQGAHDDPINVHGTYLKVTNFLSSTKVNVQFQHHESWGFEAFFVGDSIEFINSKTMLSLQGAKVIGVKRIDDRNIQVEFDAPVPLSSYQSMTLMLENTTWTPEVEIRKCHFSRVPTRGILLTTRRRSVIEDNTFYKMQMAGIYVSGDASSWYESGKVTNLTIRRNKFIECGSPVIYFDPTNSENGGAVHSNVIIDNNEFYIKSGQAVGGKSVQNLSFTNNTIYTTSTNSADNFCNVSQSSGITRSGNSCVNPSQILLKETSCSATSSLNSYDPSNVIDGKNSTSWRPESDDTKKEITLNFREKININRIQILPVSSSALKFQVSVSQDSLTWEPVIDLADNTAIGNSFLNTGNLGKNIQYARIKFLNPAINIAELRFFGGSSYLEKENQISGTVIGTSGSWNNVAEATKEAVFDFDTETFFDAPASTGWVGLDFGKDHSFVVDSICYAPRSNDEGRGRLVGGRFELSNNKNFTGAVTVFTVTQKPAAGYHTISVNRTEAYRYGRYVSPENGFCNISELLFFGKKIPTGIGPIDKQKTQIKIVQGNHSATLFFPDSWSQSKQITICTLNGSTVSKTETDGKTLELFYLGQQRTLYLVTVKCGSKSQHIKVAL